MTRFVGMVLVVVALGACQALPDDPSGDFEPAGAYELDCAQGLDAGVCRLVASEVMETVGAGRLDPDAVLVSRLPCAALTNPPGFPPRDCFSATLTTPGRGDVVVYLVEAQDGSLQVVQTLFAP